MSTMQHGGHNELVVNGLVEERPVDGLPPVLVIDGRVEEHLVVDGLVGERPVDGLHHGDTVEPVDNGLVGEPC